MGRKPGSKNRKPDDSNGIGHNGGETLDAPAELTDEQRQVLWFSAKRRIMSLKAAMASTNSELRLEFKKLKADLGFLRSDVEYALGLEDDDAEETHRRRMTIARWEQHPIGLQADMFPVDRTPAVDRAYADGKRAGLAGERAEPQWHETTEQYQRYMEGFHEGNAVLAQGIKPVTRAEIIKNLEPWPDDAQIGTEAATAGPSEA